ncbi:MAG: hypothetical protein WCP91_00850, partial [Candidatus Berkelbacteria bacterium]
MKQLFSKFLIVLCLTTIVVPITLLDNFHPEKVLASTEDIYNGLPSDSGDPTMDNGEADADARVGGIEIDGWTAPVDTPVVPPAISDINTFFDSNYTGSADSGFLWAAENITQNPKLIINPADMQDLRILSCLGNVIPDYAHHDDSLASATGKSLQDIVDLKRDHYEDWQKLITQAQETARQNIVANLKTDLPNFACIAGVDTTRATDMMQYDQDSVNAIIDYAQNKIVIDRRVLMLLTNLVTPKDQGGAGHDLISVLRIRRSYDRDSQMYSKESDAIRQQLAQEQEKSTVSTVSDVSGANATQLSADPEFAGAEAQAAVVNSAGQNQGDIIFSTAEDDINLSAHSRGEAVDIDQVDNVRCTLIKKKRIGSDNLTMQPATPIKIAWQTSAGYDSSPPPDYSSLQMNLSQIASGQYLDMLDQLGVSADSTENLSSASFGDVVSLVGESLLAEVLNSPSSSISGFSLSDTIKKIGGMILADKLGLPRQPFIEADLTNLSDLETKIGEASFEKSLNINYGSVRGNNLSDVLENIGLRYTEKQLGIQSGTIKPDSMSGASLQLAIGRGMIEQTLKLQAGSFQSDTTFKKLEEIAGQRKIDYLFTNPTEIDDLLHLGIADNNSLKFKNSSDSPDTYATIVGAKVLADHAYIYGYASSAANAMNLAPSQSTGDPRINSTQVNTNLTTSGNAATDRFQSIMTGTLTASAVIDYNNSFHNLYRAIGIDTLSTSLSSSADVRLAFSSWLNTNTNSSQTDCTIKNNITISIAKPGSTTGETEQVVLPEDQVMATFGLRRGDMSRLFGCYNSTPSAVFKGIGESALYNAVKTSSIAEQAQTKFLADHPEISNFLADVDFYQARIKLIQDKVSKIKTDWNGQSNGNAQLQAAIEQINSATNSIQGKIAGINTSGINITNIGANVGVIRQIPTIVDQVLTAVNTAQNGGDQSLRDHANATLTDINEVIHAVDEILSGKEQSSISSLQIGDINTSGNGNNSSSASTTSTNSINRATLVLMLSGKLSPKDFLVSIGANMVENSLNLPTNGVLYFAKYLDAPGRDKNDDKAAFFRAIGQAQFEQTLGMPTFFFQGQYPATLATLSDVRDHVSKSFGISSAEAGARLMQAMGVPGDFSTVEDQTISTISSVVQAANSLDSRLSIKTGTTANFLNGSPVAKSDLGNSDIQMLAGKLNLPEDVITKFIHVRNGDETLEKAKENNFASEISYNDHNPYAAAPTPTTASPDANIHTTDNCPLGFTFNSATKTFSSQFIEDSSYIYTDNTGTHSFPSMADARNYANAATNQSNKIDFVQALSLHSAKDATKVAAINQGITNFIVDPNDAKALSDDDMAWLRDHYQIPVDILNNTFTRQDLVNKQGTSKQIGYYLETLGKTTAERRVTSALLGGITMTFAGLQIDATDIFDALSGNGLQVAYKIGAKYLENQLKINSTLVGKILEAPTAALRNCSLSAIGGNLLGGVLGLGSVSLSGNIYENIGGAKIEQVLGLAASSFRGANIDELITSIGPSKFASVFELPANIVAPTSVTSNLVGAEEAAYISSLPADEQMSGIDNIFQMPDSVPNVSSATLASAGSQIDSLVRNFIHDSSIWTPVTNPSS